MRERVCVCVCFVFVCISVCIHVTVCVYTDNLLKNAEQPLMDHALNLIHNTFQSLIKAVSP